MRRSAAVISLLRTRSSSLARFHAGRLRQFSFDINPQIARQKLRSRFSSTAGGLSPGWVRIGIALRRAPGFYLIIARAIYGVTFFAVRWVLEARNSTFASISVWP